MTVIEAAVLTSRCSSGTAMAGVDQRMLVGQVRAPLVLNSSSETPLRACRQHSCVRSVGRGPDLNLPVVPTFRPLIAKSLRCGPPFSSSTPPNPSSRDLEI